MKTFTPITKELYCSQIEKVGSCTIHELDCQFDLHFDVKRCIGGREELCIVGQDDSWIHVAWDAVIEITIMDGLAVIVVDQNLFRKDV